MYFWSKQGVKLSAELELKKTLDVDSILSQYKMFIEQWKDVKHPLFFTLSDIDIRKKIRNDKNIISCEIIVDNINSFSSPSKIIKSFEPFDKLSLIRQLIDTNYTTTTNNKLKIFWHLSMLRINETGKFGFWLPQPPQLWADKQKNKQSKISIMFLLFDFFGFSYDTKSDFLTVCRNLEEEGKVPWGWNIFIEHYLNNSGYSDLLFSAIFYKIWLYRTANYLAMTDKALDPDEYEILHSFGRQLNLSEKQMKYLDVISQKYTHQASNTSWINEFLLD